MSEQTSKGTAVRPQDDLFGHLLRGEGQIHVRLRQVGFRITTRHPEQPFPLALVDHAQACGEVEVRHVEQHRAVFPDVHQLGGDPPHEVFCARCSGVAASYHLFTQNPVKRRFLKMNMPLGTQRGCKLIAP